MAQYRSDIPYGYGDVSHAGYWMPDTPDFLEKREERRAASKDSARAWEQVRAESRRRAQEAFEAERAQGAPPREGFAAPAGRPASIIDFERIGRPAHAAETPSAAKPAHARGASRRSAWDGAGSRERERAVPARAGRFPEEEAEPVRDNRALRRASTRRGGYAGFDAVPARTRGTEGGRPTGGFEGEYAARAGEAAVAGGRDVRGPGSGSLSERVERSRRERRKRRAERDFSRAYGDAPEPSTEDAAPRAALYETRMGRTQQRASRMQERGQASIALPDSLVRALSAVFAAPVGHPWFARTALTFACVLLVGAMLFPAAQGYYLQVRENDQLNAEYQAVMGRNDELGRQVRELQTDEGMAQLAHDSLGWVSDGEHSVSVVESGSADGDAAAAGADAAETGDAGADEGRAAVSGPVVEGSVPAPETWYSPVLDVIFGYGG